MADLGSDIAGVTDLDPALSIVTGRRALAEAIMRRLTSRKGSLPDDEDYGYDLRLLIGSAVTREQVEQGVRSQVFAEERVEDAEVTVTFIGETIQVDLRITDGDGPFSLVLGVDALSVETLEFSG